MIHPKPQPYRNERYLEFVKIQSMTCHYCVDGPVHDAHHTSLGNDDGTGTKPPDNQALPICRTCHNTVKKRAAFEDAKAVIRLNAEFLSNLQIAALKIMSAREAVKRDPSTEGIELVEMSVDRILMELAGVSRETDTPF